MRPGTLRAAALFTALVAALAIAYVVPLVAVAIVWPFLFVAPGWWLVRWSSARLTGVERLALAIVLSVAASAHLVYWLSWLSGSYDRIDIFVAALLGLAPLALQRRFHPGDAVVAARHFASRDRGPLALAALASGFVGVVLGVSIWSVDGSGVSTSAVGWSDLLVHLSIAQSVNAGNFPPEVPYFAGVPLTYHWFSDFHSAIAALAAGLFPIATFVVGSCLLTVSLALGVFALARRLTGSRRAALLAVLLAIFGGGMGYLRFFGDLAATGADPWVLLTGTTYDNRWLTDWPYFRVPSVMGTGLLTHRATTAGLPMLVGAVLLLVIGLPSSRARREGRRDLPRVIALAGLLAAFTAPFHFFLFPAVLLLALIYVLASGRLLDPTAPRNAALFLAPLTLALPHVITPLSVASGGERIQFRLWWEAPVADGPAAVAFFYVTNLGVPLLLAAVALLRPRTPARTFLAVWIVAMFAIPNLAVFSAVSFDMNKYFQAMWMASAIAGAWLIRGWHPVAIALVVGASVASPLQVGLYAVSERWGMLSSADLAASRWAAVETQPKSVFVTDGWLHSFTDVAGRLRLTSFGPYVANLGYDPSEREAQVRQIYCGGDVRRAAELMRRLGAEYVVVGSTLAGCESPVAFDASPGFKLVFEEGNLRIWQLRSADSQDG